MMQILKELLWNLDFDDEEGEDKRPDEVEGGGSWLRCALQWAVARTWRPAAMKRTEEAERTDEVLVCVHKTQIVFHVNIFTHNKAVISPLN